MTSAVAISLGVLSVVALLLGALILGRYGRERRLWNLYWGTGIVLVFVTLVEESALDAGMWSQLLIRSYLVITAVLVGVLSLGSAELALSRRWKYLWFGFIGVVSAACVAVGALTPVPSSIMFDGAVWSLPPTIVVVASSLVTVPGAAMLIGTSLYGVVRQRRFYLLYVTLGTIVFALGGSLYIASFPAAMYFADFAGTVLLFFGFVRVTDRSAAAVRTATA